MPNVAKDIFKDFNQKNTILDCTVENINLYKKSKKIGIELIAPHKINLKELVEFEEYLKAKFNVEKIEFNIKYSEKPEFTLENDWQDIIKYVSLKMPIIKPIISSSNIKLEGKTILIILKTNTAEFLTSYKVDKALEKLILNLYGEKYIIKCEENLDDGVIKNNHLYLEELEKEACKNILEYNETLKVQNELQKEQETNIEENKKEIDGKKALILGRTDKIKEKIIKVKDVSIDYGKVAIEGKIISKDTRELKNGKTLLMFNLYDGTSTITCKSFLEQDKKDRNIKKNRKSKKSKNSRKYSI